jgi:hypothetical protein
VKKINRNAFNEKLIHRYLFETYYLDKKERINLVPKRLQSKMSGLNLVVPEDVKSFDDYRADFSLYFKGDSNFYPVEVKWKSSDLKKSNQLQALANNNGFLVSFDKPNIDHIDHATINKDHFQNWLIKRVELLYEESLSDKVEIKQGSGKWIVILRSKHALNNFSKMEGMMGKTSKRFWAFKNSMFVMRNLLNVKKGDEMIFLFIKTTHPEGSAMIPASNNNFELYKACFTKITEPYYMELEGKKSTFFEGNDIPAISERKWPHFFNFDIQEEHNFEPSVFVERRTMEKDLKTRIANSANQGGVLESLTDLQLQEIKAIVRTSKKS